MGGFTPAPSEPSKDVKTTASDTLLKESTGEQSATSLTYTKKKAIGMPSNRIRTTVRVTFTLKSATNGINARGKLYYNGSAVGTERSNNTTSYVEQSEDIEISTNGGTIELWLKTANSSHPAFSDNLSIKGAEVEVNQDYEVIL